MDRRNVLPRIAPLLLALLLVRAVLPTGWMPVAQDTGVVWQLCPSVVPAAAQSPSMMATAKHADGAAHAEHRGEGARDPCPFGALTGAGAALPQSPAIADRLPFVQPRMVALATVGLRQQRWLAHAFARGPPATA